LNGGRRGRIAALHEKNWDWVEKRCFAGIGLEPLWQRSEATINAIRSLQMSTTFSDAARLRFAGPASPDAGVHQTDSWRVLAWLWRLMRLWAARRSQRQVLADLAGESHRLADIGLTREQALREAAKPFWQR
jgi:uncharacterized protein YjiS (DUF1127 family)